MDDRDGQPAVLQHPTLDLQVVVRERLAAVLRRYGYMDVIEPADELPEIDGTEEKDDAR